MKYNTEEIRLERSIGANIRARRLELRMNQEELAKKLGLTQANVSRIESNTKGPSAEMLIALSDALSCDVRELLGIKETGEPARDLDAEAKSAILNAIKNDPQLGLCLRNFARESGLFEDEDWKFTAAYLKLTLGHVSEVIKARNFRNLGA
ncbi:MAG: helix-turn-helix domain-containing protein [Synergistaceae bacterium]|nr:helix-turn-helix domain-containing protein [Synergistaceae bacterium]